MRHFATKAGGFKARNVRWGVGTALLAALLTLLCLSSYALNLEQKTGLRWLFQWRGPIKPPSDVLIVALNSAAAENLQLPRQTNAWPRRIYADLLQRLRLAGASLVVMDIAFKETRGEDEDAALETALADSGRVVLFKYIRRQQISLGGGLADIEEEITPLPRFAKHARAVGSFVLPKYPAEVSQAYLFTELARGVEATQPVLAFLALQPQAARRDLWQELKLPGEAPDNVTDWAREVYPYSERLALESSRPGHERLLATLRLPNPLPINFYGPAGTLTTVSIDQVLASSEDEARALFLNKVVYVGYSDDRQTEQQDAYRTVFSDKRGLDISGVEISATVFTNILEMNYIRPPAHWQIVGLSLFFFVVALLFQRLSFTAAAFLQLTIIAFYLASAYYSFCHRFIWLPISLPLLGLLLGNSVMWIWHYLQQKRREQEIRYMLTQYLPSDAAQKLSRNFSQLEQQRQLVQGVCLLTDVQGYTRLAETLSPGELHGLMNRYYAVLIGAVEEHGGFIGNLVGDGMLALWTGPQIDEALCNAALQTAVTIQERLANEPDLRDKLPTCFGVHGGQFSLGNLGHTGHFEYSPVGDMINTAARIEHFNRQLGTRILCSGPVAEHLLATNPAKLRFLGNFSLRNKATPVALYTYAEAHTDLLTRFKQAYEYYADGQFGLALAQFARITDDYSDGPSIYFVNACRQELHPKEQ